MESSRNRYFVRHSHNKVNLYEGVNGKSDIYMKALMVRAIFSLCGAFFLVAVLYGGYLQYRVINFSAETRHFLRVVLFASDTAHLSGGYWENTLIRVIGESVILPPPYRAELYVGLIVLTDLDTSRAYLFLTEVADDEEGHAYLSFHHEEILASLGISESSADLVRHWVGEISRYAKMRGGRNN